MELTNEEKEVFLSYRKDINGPASYLVSDIINDVYWPQEDYSNLYVVFNYIKRMIIEVAKKKNYSITPDITYDMNETLHSIVGDFLDADDFSVDFYKDSEQLSHYFCNCMNQYDSDKMGILFQNFQYANGAFRSFFENYISNMANFVEQLDRELNSEDISDALPSSELVLEFDSSEFFDDAPIGLPEDFHVNVPSNMEEDLSEEKLLDYLKFINILPYLIQCRNRGVEVFYQLLPLVSQMKLNDFYSDSDFEKNLDIIMKHDCKKHHYYYHGTQCLDDAASILKQGLGMNRDKISTTAISEMTRDDILLYQRGIDQSIGHDAVVIIDFPVDENGRDVPIIQNMNSNYHISFNASGLQGLDAKPNYIIPTEYLVGYVDKVHKKVVFNPQYKDYVKFMVSTDESIGVEDSKTYS